MGDIVAFDAPEAQLAHRLTALCREARHEVFALYPDVATAGTLVSRMVDAAGRGPVMRHVVPDRDVAAGVPNVRVRTSPVGGLFVFDRSTALVCAADATDPVELSDGGTVGLLCMLFEQVWVTAEARGGLTDQQVTAVRLLADGHTDDAIAKRLGVSARTARRIVTRLMERLGAHGRFQAGVRAAEAGWLAGQPANRSFDVRTTG